MSYSQTFERPDVKIAARNLMKNMAPTLIKSIYRNKEEYNEPVVRVGLVLKVLLKLDLEKNPLDSDILEPVIDDLRQVIKNTQDEFQKNIYEDELRYLKCCIIHSDMVTLNALKH
jgi:hypothetical protein